MTIGLSSLPPELLYCILDFLPSIDLQKTTLSLLHVLSYGAIPNWRHYLFYHVHLRIPDSVYRLITHLQRAPGDAAFIQKLSLASWTVDAKVAANVILMLPRLKWLSLSMGVSFTPDLLEKLFRKPMLNLQYLSFRLRPYLLEDNYQRSLVYQFLKSTYFDSVIAILATWPSMNLPSVSVILDPRDVSLVDTNSPGPQTSFFDLYKLEILSSSPILERTRAFRLRLPGRDLARFLCRNVPSLPSIELLDLSTSSVPVSDVHLLLRSLPSLRHIVLDGCGTLDEAPSKEWEEFGLSCLMINNGQKPEEEENEKSASASQSQAVSTHEPTSSPIIPRVTILPRTSALRTIALSAPPLADANAQRALIAAFQRGWSKGMTEFNDRLRAVRQSRSNGLRALRFALPDEAEDCILRSGYHRMVTVDDDQFVHLDSVMGDERCPVVCLGGKLGMKGGIGHAEGCSHSVGWGIWEDTL